MNKLIFLQDVDVVFTDEADFYSQIIKLLTMTKVPIILSASSHAYLANNLFPLLQRNSLQFDQV